MATYKQPCVHCGMLIDRDARFCPNCASRSPFGYLCPTCLHPIEKGQRVCPGCGRSLYIECPHCSEQTFVDERCEICGKSLLVQCGNKRCGEMQFFQNTKCTACGKKIKA
jgi:RNA polymerase subunit RPABC4/transcription elongation factor Spt4